MSDKLNIPESWAETNLQVLIDVRDGTHDSPKLIDEGVMFVTSKNLKSGSLSFEKCSYISQADHDKIKQRSEVARGDIIMAMIGTIGNPVIVDTDNEFSIKNIALFKKNKQFEDLRYLKYFIDSPLFAEIVKNKKKGTTQKFLSLGVLRGLNFPVPAKKEQFRIVEKIESCFSKTNKRRI